MEPAEKTITVKTFDLPIEANMAMHKLQLQGIPCFITNEHMAGAFAMPINPLFAIELNVFESDFTKASEILSEEKTNLSSVCPRCQSPNIQFTYSKSWLGRIFTLVAGLLFGVVPPHGRTFYCQTCKHEFANPVTPGQGTSA